MVYKAANEGPQSVHGSEAVVQSSGDGQKGASGSGSSGQHGTGEVCQEKTGVSQTRLA